MPVDAQKEISRAEKLLAKCDATAAREIYLSLLAIYPENPAARKGLNRLAVTQDAESVQQMTFTEQFSNLVLAYNSDDHLMVLESGKALAEQFPDQAMLLFLLGSSCHILGRHNEAIDYYRSALKLDPSIALAHVGLGNLC